MTENTRITILCGGYWVCTPKWNKDRSTGSFRDTFDFLLPLSGSVTIETTGGECRVKPGHVYFIPGRNVVRWSCDNKCPVYWVATAMDSFFLRHRLAGIHNVHEWPLSKAPAADRVFRRFGEFFTEEKLDVGRMRSDDDSRPRDAFPPGLSIQIEAVLMYLVGLLLEDTEKEFREKDHSGLERIKPAIDFMDANFLRNPSLHEIAGEIRLAPHYFRQFFRRETGLSPFKYMENRRMDLARKLLSDRRLNISEVARQAGYESPLYFSRAFRRRFNCSPSQARENP